MAVVSIVPVTALVLVVGKVMVWVAAINNMVVVVEVLGVTVLVDVEFIVLAVSAIVLKFALAVTYSADVSSDVAVDLFMDALAGVMLRVLTGISIEVLVLADVSANAFGVVMTTLAFPV